MKRILSFLFCLIVCGIWTVQAQTVTITPGTTYQTMRGLGASCFAGQTLEPGDGTISDNPSYATFRDTLLDQAVNDLGLSGVRLEIRSGTENTQDFYAQWKAGTITEAEFRCLRYSVINDNSNANSINASGFKWTELDEKITKVVVPLRALLAARGEALRVTVCYVSFTNQMTGSGCSAGLANTHNSTPTEYAEFVLATYQHMQATFSFVPDDWEVMLEPLNQNNWTAAQLGPAVVAAGNRLAAAGFTPRFVVPSCSTRPVSVTTFDTILQTAGVGPYLDMISFHTYNGWNDVSGMTAIATRAAANNIKSGMLEHIGGDVNELHFELRYANVSSWLQYVLASPNGTGSPIGNNKLFHISGTTVSVTDFFARYARQYFRYVRPGAIRVGSSSSNGALDPLAWRNTDNKYVVVTKTTGASGTFTIGGLPAATYGIFYTTASAAGTALSDQTITTGQNISTSIPAAGVITVYAKSGVTPPTNVAPTCNAGPNQTITLPAVANLDGTASDDGLPAPPATMTTTWSKFSGTGTVTFGNANAQDTTATFPGSGTYVLRLTASDGTLSTTDDVQIIVNAAASNVAPTVNAGTDGSVTLPATATLDATVSDDGLPAPPNAFTVTWSKFSGPGTVNFGNANAVDTSASFSVSGTYVLRLTADDSALTTSDDVTITVSAQAASNWLAMDIGTVGVTGSFTENPAGTFTVAGAGSDIWARVDAFRFMFQNVEYQQDDADFSSQVLSQQNTHPYAKAGAMLRQNLNPDSKFAMMAITPSGAQFIYRRTPGNSGLPGSTAVLGGSLSTARAPYFTRIRRNGSNISGWVSSDGSNWVQVGSTVKINFSFDPTTQRGPCYVGNAVTSHNIGAASTVVFENTNTDFSAAAPWFYVSPSGSGTLAADNFLTPASVRTVATGSDVAAIPDGSTIWLRGGTYSGRLRWGIDASAAGSGSSYPSPIVDEQTGANIVNLTGRITVRSYPDEWAVFDGPMETTLTQDITTTANTENIHVADSNLFFLGASKVIAVGAEWMQVEGIVSSTEVNILNRGFGNTTAAISTCALSPLTHCAGKVVRFSGEVFLYDGSFMDFRDFEVTVNSAQSRSIDLNTYDPLLRPTISNHLGSDNRVINVVLHEGGTGFTDQTGGDNSENYGLLVYNNGLFALNGGAGHNIYFQADTPKILKEIITGTGAANSWNISSTTAPFVAEGLVFSLSINSSLRMSDSVNLTNSFAYMDAPQVGPDTGSDSPGTLTFTNNYFVGTLPCKLMAFASGTITGNTCIGTAANSGASMTIRYKSGGSAADYEVDLNKYYRGRTGIKSVFQMQSVQHFYDTAGGSPNWKGLTGSGGAYERSSCLYSTNAVPHEDAPCFFHENTSASLAALPSVNAVFGRINAYDSNRANLIIYNWTGGSTVSVNPATFTLAGVMTPFLAAGDIYEVRYAHNYFGDPVIPATVYTSGNITVPMTPREIAPMIGGWTREADTLPTFGVFVVLKK